MQNELNNKVTNLRGPSVEPLYRIVFFLIRTGLIVSLLAAIG